MSSDEVMQEVNGRVKVSQNASMKRNLDLLNTGTGFLPLKRFGDLTLGRRYRVKSAEIKLNIYGRRACLVIEDQFETNNTGDEANYIIFLSPSYADAKKVRLNYLIEIIIFIFFFF